MASGMKWLALVLIGCAALSAIARTYPVLPERRERAKDRLSVEAQRNLIALNAADLAYREHAHADSLLPMLPPVPGVVVGLSPALNDEARDTLHALLAREIAAIGSPRARIGIFLLDGSYGGHPDVRVGGPGSGRQIHAGVDSAGAYCAMVGTGHVPEHGDMSVHAIQYVHRNRRAGVLGPCTFFARYGAPGAQVSQWLDDGAYALAEVPGPAWHVDIRAQARERWRSWSDTDILFRGCTAGRDELCRELVTFPAAERLPHEGAATARLQSAYMYAGNVHRMLLSEMAASFGAERFEQFWTSDEEVPAAFANAFGLEMTEWLRDWGEANYGRQQLGAAVGGGTLVLSILMVLIAGGIAAAVATRRNL
ncbi:MAG TPA: hypothetical protein VHG09_07195 [Longimicrobiales bacterium]|nr:hypothetical protein [Longimicrobiales bacterium]